jgi:hypothetical protein
VIADGSGEVISTKRDLFACTGSFKFDAGKAHWDSQQKWAVHAVVAVFTFVPDQESFAFPECLRIAVDVWKRRSDFD